MNHDYFCTAAWPAYPYGLQCTLPMGHRGEHRHGDREWTDEQAIDLVHRAEIAAADAAHRARAAVLNGHVAGPVAVGANRSERRRGQRPHR